MGCCCLRAGQGLVLLETAGVLTGFGSKSQTLVWRQKAGRDMREPVGCGGGWVRPGPPPLGCPQLPGQPQSSMEANPPLQRSDPGHIHVSPTSLCTAVHPTLPRIRAPLDDAVPHAHPGELLQPPPNSQKLGLCLQSAMAGLSHAGYRLGLLAADDVFKSTLVERQAAAGRRGTST